VRLPRARVVLVVIIALLFVLMRLLRR